MHMFTAEEAKINTKRVRRNMYEQELIYIENAISRAVSDGKETVCLDKSISDGAAKKLNELGYKLSFGTTRYSSGESKHTRYVSWSD